MSDIPTTSDELLKRNSKFLPNYRPQITFPHGVSLQDTQRMIIVSCMDQRVHPEEILGLNTGDIPVIRNAGGTAKNAVLDITVLDTIIQITEIVVIHHTNCGLTLTSDAAIRSTLEERLSDKDEIERYGVEGMCFTDVPQSVRDDVAYLRGHELIRKETKVSGFVYDTETGKLARVE